MADIETEREIERLAKEIAEEVGAPHHSLVMTDAYYLYHFKGMRPDDDKGGQE